MVLARAAGAAGEDDVKERALIELLKLEPDNPDALWALAGVLGEKLEATGKEGTMYKAFEARFPDDPRAKEAAARGAEPAETPAGNAEDGAADDAEEPQE